MISQWHAKLPVHNKTERICREMKNKCCTSLWSVTKYLQDTVHTLLWTSLSQSIH